VRIYALVSAETEKVIDFYADEPAAQAALAESLEDEPEWADVLRSRPASASGPGSRTDGPNSIPAVLPFLSTLRRDGVGRSGRIPQAAPRLGAGSSGTEQLYGLAA